MKIYCYNIVVLIFFLFLLEGCLPAIFVGATGTTLEFAKNRSTDDTINDIKISASLKAAFIKNNFRDLYSKINVEVMQGRVLLTGNIEKTEDSIIAIKLAWEQEGVIEVINELKIDKNSNHFDLLQYTRDALITSQIKSKTLIDCNVKFSNYTVITIDDIVYLFGIARSKEELKIVANIASNICGVTKVISHVRINNTL